jgi:hypothetical protein
MDRYSSSKPLKLDVQLGFFLKHFLSVDPGVREWTIRGNE